MFLDLETENTSILRSYCINIDTFLFLKCQIFGVIYQGIESVLLYFYSSNKMYTRWILTRFASVTTLFCIALSVFTSANANVAVTPGYAKVEEGSEFEFTCTNTGSGESLIWSRKLPNNTDVVLGNSPKYMIWSILSNNTSEGHLKIHKLTVADSGSYECSSGNDGFNAELQVFPVKNVAIYPSYPEFVEGANLVLSCTINNASSEAILWQFNNGKEVTTLSGGDDSSHIQVLNNGTLIIRTLAPTDAGIYICTHTFSQGSKSTDVNVGGEIVLTAPRSVKYTEGDRALIECEAHVKSKALLPNITWTVNGEDLADACPDRCSLRVKNTEHTVTSKLEVVKITMDDRANYSCIAFNGASEESKDILLRVRDRLAALWPFLGIMCEVVLLIIIIFIHEKCSKGEDYGEDDEDEEDLKKEKKKIPDSDNDMQNTCQSGKE